MLLKKMVFQLVMILLLIVTKTALAAPINLNIVSNSSWQSTDTFSVGWETVSFDDTGWQPARSLYPNPFTSPTDLIPGTAASLIWYDPSGSSDGTTGSNEAYFRYSFFLNLQADSLPLIGQALIQVDDDYDFYVNGTLRFQNHDEGFANIVDFVDFTSLLQNGINVIAIHAKDGGWSNSYNRLYEDLLFDGIVKTVGVPEPESSLLLILAVAILALRHKHGVILNSKLQ